MLAEAGLHLSDLKEFSFLGHQDAVIKGLLDGGYDAGALPEVTAKRYEGRGLNIVKTSIDIPEKIMCASKHLDPQTSDLVKKALIALDRKNQSHVEILGRVSQGYSGFEAANDEEYDGVRKLMQKILGADVVL
jgi:ABC-type phosphate/phosphonate transport system substrate-binding protein